MRHISLQHADTQFLFNYMKLREKRSDYCGLQYAHLICYIAFQAGVQKLTRYDMQSSVTLCITVCRNLTQR
jgi:hypothetical protein